LNDVVLDASVVLKWFHSEGERHLDAARSLRAEFEAGELLVFAPPLLRFELVNVAGRRWGWAESALVEFALGLEELGFEFIDPELERVAIWTARGLTAYDAAYVAVAEENALRLITDDELIVDVAGELATGLAEANS
jgi:predicted nucleic acid-binding protein